MSEYDFSKYVVEAAGGPFKLNVPASGDKKAYQIVVGPPDAEKTLQLDEVTTMRARCRIICGDKWPEIYELMKDKHPSGLDLLISDILDHFKVDTSGN